MRDEEKNTERTIFDALSNFCAILCALLFVVWVICHILA